MSWKIKYDKMIEKLKSDKCSDWADVALELSSKEELNFGDRKLLQCAITQLTQKIDSLERPGEK